jgi:hypothetical protein
MDLQVVNNGWMNSAGDSLANSDLWMNAFEGVQESA